jgi:hypothetical protein
MIYVFLPHHEHGNKVNYLYFVLLIELFSVLAFWFAERMNPIEENFAQKCEEKFFKIGRKYNKKLKPLEFNYKKH